MVKIDDVKRVDGRVVRVTAFVGDIEINYIRPKGGGDPKEVSRLRDGVRVLDQDTLWISPGDYPELRRRINKIFSEVRPVKSHRPRKKKLQSELQEKLF